jgi:hypothetical protein
LGTAEFVLNILGTRLRGWWVGVNDLAKEGSYCDVSGNPVSYLNWFPGNLDPNDEKLRCGRIAVAGFSSNKGSEVYNAQPSVNPIPSQDCVELNRVITAPDQRKHDVGQFYWNDAYCSDAKKYICRIKRRMITVYGLNKLTISFTS